MRSIQLREKRQNSKYRPCCNILRRKTTKGAKSDFPRNIMRIRRKSSVGYKKIDGCIEYTKYYFSDRLSIFDVWQQSVNLKLQLGNMHTKQRFFWRSDKFDTVYTSSEDRVRKYTDEQHRLSVRLSANSKFDVVTVVGILSECSH